MMPIHELLNRIRWDKDFSKGDFKIGYFDRIENKIILVALQEIHFDEEDHFSFQIMDEEGAIHTIPLHRIKEVYKDGHLIWNRSGK